MTFWDHLDELRGCLVKMLAAALVCAIAAFCCKELLFSVVLAPNNPNFITYRWFSRLMGAQPFEPITLINVDIAQQFVIHMRVALYVGLLVVSPYILYLLFHFVAPGLYAHERRYTVRAVGVGYLLFILGVLFNYFVIFPFAFRFLGTYQVDSTIANQITLGSYISLLLMLCLVMGLLFELPVLCWLLAKIGLLQASSMTRFRRHAVVVILIVAAVITPTGDPVTLSLVALPIYLLYELSINIVRHVHPYPNTPVK